MELQMEAFGFLSTTHAKINKMHPWSLRFAHLVAFHKCLSSHSDRSRCRGRTYLTNLGYFDKHTNPPNWRPCLEENGADSWISILILGYQYMLCEEPHQFSTSQTIKWAIMLFHLKPMYFLWKIHHGSSQDIPTLSALCFKFLRVNDLTHSFVTDTSVSTNFLSQAGWTKFRKKLALDHSSSDFQHSQVLISLFFPFFKKFDYRYFQWFDRFKIMS